MDKFYVGGVRKMSVKGQKLLVVRIGDTSIAKSKTNWRNMGIEVS